MRDAGDRFLVLVTGYAATGKTTLAPKIADELGALWISRDHIHELVYSGWEPQHPALFQDGYDPHVGGSTYLEGRVVWSIFLWMLQRVTSKTAVVADTPFNHDWNRDMFHSAASSIDVPMIEVALHGDPDVLLDRARRRAGSRSVHPIKAKFSLNPDRYFSGEYQPVLPAGQVINVDTTNLDAVEPEQISGTVRHRLKSRLGR
ncbi:MAG: AAA family ATPase [Nocardioidaceae bacterium]